MRLFWLNRRVDKSGVSGTGIIAEGVVLSDGTAVLRWLKGHKSTAIYDNVQQLVAIHGHQHATLVTFDRPASQRLIAVTQAELNELNRKTCASAKRKPPKRKAKAKG
jgi:hypothetical protein